METLKHKHLSATKLLDKLTPFTTLKPNRFGKQPIHLRNSEYLCLRPSPSCIDELMKAVDDRSDWELVDECINKRHYRLDGKLVYGVVLHHIPTDTYILVRLCYKMGVDINAYFDGKGGKVESSPLIRLTKRWGEPPYQLKVLAPHTGDLGNLAFDPEGKFVWVAKGHPAHIHREDEDGLLVQDTLWPTVWNITSGGK